jgi:cyanophycinase
MGVFLVGGGWSDELAVELFGGFGDAAAERAGTDRPRVLLVVMGTDDEAVEYHEKYVRALGLAGITTLAVERVAEGGTFPVDALEGIDGLFVGGGPTPEYHAALGPAYARIRELVAAGLPYAGFSAGAAIAATTAIIGGWRIDGMPVCPEDSNEELDPVTVVDGIGLVEGAVEVHAAQWGNLSRLVAAVELGLVPHGIAIDEGAVVEVATGAVRGTGRVWHVTPGPGGGASIACNAGSTSPRPLPGAHPAP